MKEVLIPVIAIVSLMAMSFTNTADKMEMVQTENGTHLTNTHLLSLEDLKAIDQMTVVGASESSFVNTTVYKEFVNKTIHTSDPIGKRSSKLEAILVKY